MKILRNESFTRMVEKIEEQKIQIQCLEEELDRSRARYYEAINLNNNLQTEYSRIQSRSKALEDSIQRFIKQVESLEKKIVLLETAIQYKEQYL